MRMKEGLSPRVRGNPLCIGYSSAARGDYPRVCGGTVALWSSGQRRQGLSPRVRGNPMLAQRPKPRLGTIPACAGEPVIRRSAPNRHRDYPRVCGGTSYGKYMDG